MSFKAFVFLAALFSFPVCLGTAFPAAEQEQLTINTFYPIPSGTYGQLIVTEKTYINTSGTGSVGIGTTAVQGLLQVGVSPSPGLIVASSGNVGIGTTDPGSYRLYVDGDVYMSDPNTGGFSGTIVLLKSDMSNCTMNVQAGVIMLPGSGDRTQPCG